jgi:MOSC domain-containing protein YiiM
VAGPSVSRAVAAAAGQGARLVRDDDLDRFDVLPLLVATDGAIAGLGYDGRRLRPNLVVAGVEGLAERAWEGRRLRVGGALIEAVSLRRRCIMTTFDPDTAIQDVEVLRRIHREFDGRLALDCQVLEGGPVAEGDRVSLV